MNVFRGHLLLHFKHISEIDVSTDSAAHNYADTAFLRLSVGLWAWAAMSNPTEFKVKDPLKGPRDICIKCLNKYIHQSLKQ